MTRPSIPPELRAQIFERDKGICQTCDHKIPDITQADINHNPPLWARQRNFDYLPSNPKHYIPNANDPRYLFTVHSSLRSVEACHDLQTHGDGLYRGDVKEAARTKRIQTKHGRDANGNKIAQPAETAVNRPKRKWRSRPLPKGRKVPGGKKTPWARRYNKETKRWVTVRREA